MKSLHLILVLFSIASMFTSFGVYDVDATKENNNGKSMGCEKANPTNNPHCNSGGGSTTTQFTACDLDGNSLIDDVELATVILDETSSDFSSITQSWIDSVDKDFDGKIGDSIELRNLNQDFLRAMGFTCK